MNVASFMTHDPLTVDPDATAESALRTMDEHAIRHLPVVEDGKLVGVVSDRDLLEAGWRVLAGSTEEPQGTSVRECMQTDVVTVGPEEPAVAPAVEVVLRGIGSLPVVERGKLVGIVTEVDLLDLYARLCRGSAPGDELDPLVEEIACVDAVVVAPEATVAQADVLCHAKGFRHLPVVRDGELVGVLSDRDLRRSAGAELSSRTSVESLMSRRVVTIRPTERASAAARQMVENRVSALPVVGDGPVGIVTSTDVLERASELLRRAGGRLGEA